MQIDEQGHIEVSNVFIRLFDAQQTNKYNIYVLEGGSRSSKTISIIQFLLAYAETYIGTPKRIIISRAVGTWITGTVLVDFLNVVKAYGWYNNRNYNKTLRIYKLFDTEFWFVGLDDEQKLHGMSSDGFWINEAIESTKEDLDQLEMRCTGFGILDYNPTEEDHWIYDTVLKRGDVKFIHSTMLDNPFIPDNSRKKILSYEPTQANYKNGTVDKRKWEIYGLGKRAKIEGLIFESFEIIKEIPEWVRKRFTGIDFGYTNDPTAMGEVGIHDNTLYIDELCYQTRMTIADITKKLKEVNLNRKIISESADPRLVDEIHNSGFNIHPVEKGKGSVEAGIEKMKTMKICITERSINAIKEFKNYTYQQDKTGKFLNVPIDDMNHCFVGETLIETNKGLRQIKSLTTRDKVLTRTGYKSVNKVFINGCKKVCNYTLDFGIFKTSIKCTPNHKILTDKGWKQIQNVTENETIYLSKNLMENSIIYTKMKCIFPEVQNAYIAPFGNTLKALSQKAITFTTKTVIPGITSLITLKLRLLKCIIHNICLLLIKANCGNGWIMPESLQTNGMVQRKVLSFTKKSENYPQKKESQKSLYVPVAKNILHQNQMGTTYFAPTIANQSLEEIPGSIMRKENAYCAEQYSLLTNTRKSSFAGSVVLESITKGLETFELVYDIEVNEQHEYFANGILAHNCIDLVRYVVLMEILGKNRTPQKNLAGLFH